MGNTGTKSKTNVDVLNEVAIGVTQKTIQSCVGTVQNTQEIVFDDVAGDFTMSGATFKQAGQVSTSCVMSANKQNEIKTAISTAISQMANAKGQAGLSALGRTQAETDAFIRNKFDFNVSQEDVNNSIAAVTNKQSIRVGKVGGNVALTGLSMDQSAEVIATGVVESTQYSKAINEIANEIDQKGVALEENMITELGKMLGMGALAVYLGPMLIGALVFLIFIGIIAAAAGGGGKKKGRSGGPRPQQSGPTNVYLGAPKGPSRFGGVTGAGGDDDDDDDDKVPSSSKSSLDDVTDKLEGIMGDIVDAHNTLVEPILLAGTDLTPPITLPCDKNKEKKSEKSDDSDDD